MDKALFDQIWARATEARKPEFVPDPSGDKRIYHQLNPDGTYQVNTVDELRSHKTNSIDTLCELVNGNQYECWYSRSGMVGIISADRHERVTMPLTVSSHLWLLADLSANRTWWTQKDLIRLLRVDLCDCLGTAGNFLSLIRTVKFDVSSSGESEVSHGKSSVGKSARAELLGIDKIPEVICLRVQVWNEFEFRNTVDVMIDIDPQTQTFCLIPKASHIEQAYVAGELFLRDLLRGKIDEEVPVYQGTP